MFWSSNICRICAQMSDICVPLFDKNSSFEIEMKMKRCMSTNILKDDLKPKQICQECCNKLNDFDDFISMFYESSYKFENIILHSTQQVNGMLQTQHVNGIVQTQHVNVIVQTQDCVNLGLSLIPIQENALISANTENLSNCSNLTMIVQYREDVPMESLVQAPVFNEQSMLNEMVTQSINVQNYESAVDINQSQENVSVLRHSNVKLDKNNYDNSYVSVAASTMENLDHKRPTDTNFNSVKNFRDANGSSYTSDNTLLNETSIELKDNDAIKKRNKINITSKFINDKHLQEEAYVSGNLINENSVELTIENAVRKRNRINIISVKSVRKKVKPVSEIEVTSKLNKKPKTKLESTPKQHLCTICNKSFSRNQHLAEHNMSKHIQLRPFKCEICGKTFTKQWVLATHKRSHTSLYQCKHCSKSFCSPSKLERHVRIHTGERPFVCEVANCGKSFSDKRNLIGHQIAHSDVRKFTCGICKHSYKTNSQLKDHKQAHSDNPAFKCAICEKTYKWKTNLVLHMKKHTGYKCDRCKKDFDKRSALVKHSKECGMDLIP